VPIFYPIALSLGIDMQWFAILIAMNLQTSFLTPPFGFSLFYLKVAPTKIANTMAVTLMVSVLVSCSIFQLRRWYNAAKTNAPTAPTAADSVGVAMPEKIEPSTAIMSEIGGTTKR
jgi:hypothetical protein